MGHTSEAQIETGRRIAYCEYRLATFSTPGGLAPHVAAKYKVSLQRARQLIAEARKRLQKREPIETGKRRRQMSVGLEAIASSAIEDGERRTAVAAFSELRKVEGLDQAAAGEASAIMFVLGLAPVDPNDDGPVDQGVLAEYMALVERIRGVEAELADEEKG